MKTLKESLIDFDRTQTTTESLFDKDLDQKNINFFDFFDIYYCSGQISAGFGSNKNDMHCMITNPDSFEWININKLFNMKELKNLPQSPYKYESVLSDYIYKKLSEIPLNQIDTYRKLRDYICDCFDEMFKVRKNGAAISMTRNGTYNIKIDDDELYDDNRRLDFRYEWWGVELEAEITLAIKRKK